MNALKILALFIGDGLALYLSLFFTLAFRYGPGFYEQLVDIHLVPFSIVFILWIGVFYLAGLYDLRRLRNNIEFLQNLGVTIAINAALSILVFYIVPAFGIAPKRNLFIFLVFFTVFEIGWRRLFNRIATFGEPPNRVLLIGDGTAAEINEVIAANPQLGYEVKYWQKENDVDSAINNLRSLIKNRRVNVVVIPRDFKKHPELARHLYELLALGIEIHDLPRFYELIFRKVPLADLEEAWFLENLVRQSAIYDLLKRLVDFFFALVLTIISLPLWPILSGLIKLSSAGPAICSQARIGQHERPYAHYKFRTMTRCDHTERPGESGGRIIAAGKLLRRTHLDELPQLWNILRGYFSLVGPRPDFVEYFEKLKAEIPYYNIRMIAKPGLTGWAQVNYPVTASVGQTKERLSYDLYYLKNKSIALDLIIILRTLKTVLTAEGK